MSMNWKEIDLVLDELDLAGSFVQQVVQPDFRNLYLNVYRPGRKQWVRICLATGETRIHATSAGPRKPTKRQRFAQLLHSRIKGGKISAVEHVNHDRIVRLEVIAAGMPTVLWIRLWGGAGNVIATDQKNMVLDAFFRRPKRNEVTGATYAPPGADQSEQPSGRRKEVVVRFDPDEGQSFSDVIDRYYGEIAEREECKKLEESIRRVFEKRESRIVKQLETARTRLAAAGEAARLQLFGDLIRTYAHTISPGDTWLEAEDYTNEGGMVTIELDPARSAVENAEEFYRRAQKSKRQRQALEEEAHNLEKRLDAVRDQLDLLDSADLETLRSLNEEAEPKRARRTDSDSLVPGLSFRSGGFVILVGRNVRENDELLRRHVRGNDVWLHTRDCPGGYVFVRAQKSKSVPLEVLLDAGNLAVHFSKARSSGHADLYYTHVKHLKRAKNGPKGLVLPTHEKNLSIRVEEQRLRRLMA